MEISNCSSISSSNNTICTQAQFQASLIPSLPTLQRQQVQAQHRHHHHHRRHHLSMLVML